MGIRRIAKIVVPGCMRDPARRSDRNRGDAFDPTASAHGDEQVVNDCTASFGCRAGGLMASTMLD